MNEFNNDPLIRFAKSYYKILSDYRRKKYTEVNRGGMIRQGIQGSHLRNSVEYFKYFNSNDFANALFKQPDSENFISVFKNSLGKYPDFMPLMFMRGDRNRTPLGLSGDNSNNLNIIQHYTNNSNAIIMPYIALWNNIIYTAPLNNDNKPPIEEYMRNMGTAMYEIVHSGPLFNNKLTEHIRKDNELPNMIIKPETEVDNTVNNNLEDVFKYEFYPDYGKYGLDVNQRNVSLQKSLFLTVKRDALYNKLTKNDIFRVLSKYLRNQFEYYKYRENGEYVYGDTHTYDTYPALRIFLTYVSEPDSTIFLSDEFNDIEFRSDLSKLYINVPNSYNNVGYTPVTTIKSPDGLYRGIPGIIPYNRLYSIDYFIEFRKRRELEANIFKYAKYQPLRFTLTGNDGDAYRTYNPYLEDSSYTNETGLAIWTNHDVSSISYNLYYDLMGMIWEYNLTVDKPLMAYKKNDNPGIKAYAAYSDLGIIAPNKEDENGNDKWANRAASYDNIEKYTMTEDDKKEFSTLVDFSNFSFGAIRDVGYSNADYGNTKRHMNFYSKYIMLMMMSRAFCIPVIEDILKNAKLMNKVKIDEMLYVIHRTLNMSLTSLKRDRYYPYDMNTLTNNLENIENLLYSGPLSLAYIKAPTLYTFREFTGSGIMEIDSPVIVYGDGRNEHPTPDNINSLMAFSPSQYINSNYAQLSKYRYFRFFSKEVYDGYTDMRYNIFSGENGTDSSNLSDLMQINYLGLDGIIKELNEKFSIIKTKGFLYKLFITCEALTRTKTLNVAYREIDQPFTDSEMDSSLPDTVNLLLINNPIFLLTHRDIIYRDLFMKAELACNAFEIIFDEYVSNKNSLKMKYYMENIVSDDMLLYKLLDLKQLKEDTDTRSDKVKTKTKYKTLEKVILYFLENSDRFIITVKDKLQLNMSRSKANEMYTDPNDTLNPTDRFDYIYSKMDNMVMTSSAYICIFELFIHLYALMDLLDRKLISYDNDLSDVLTNYSTLHEFLIGHVQTSLIPLAKYIYDEDTKEITFEEYDITTPPAEEILNKLMTAESNNKLIYKFNLLLILNTLIGKSVKHVLTTREDGNIEEVYITQGDIVYYNGYLYRYIGPSGEVNAFDNLTFKPMGLRFAK